MRTEKQNKTPGRLCVLFCRATTNNKVKETVALELSFVNSNLQLLKEELEELNSSMDVYQTDRCTNACVFVPLIPGCAY